MKFTFDSVVFQSDRLEEIRAFYERKLGFPTGTYEKNGERVPDYSDSYVNYHIGGGLVGFEQGQGESAESSIGDLVIRVSEFDAFKAKVKQAAVPIVKENEFFFMVNDPEGRTLIFEPSR
jgi:catechol 2,3-dioxygenase-like lactoylglutathione lyase family enzyme